MNIRETLAAEFDRVSDNYPEDMIRTIMATRNPGCWTPGSAIMLA